MKISFGGEALLMFVEISTELDKNEFSRVEFNFDFGFFPLDTVARWHIILPREIDKSFWAIEKMFSSEWLWDRHLFKKCFHLRKCSEFRASVSPPWLVYCSRLLLFPSLRFRFCYTFHCRRRWGRQFDSSFFEAAFWANLKTLSCYWPGSFKATQPGASLITIWDEKCTFRVFNKNADGTRGGNSIRDRVWSAYRIRGSNKISFVCVSSHSRGSSGVEMNTFLPLFPFSQADYPIIHSLNTFP